MALLRSGLDIRAMAHITSDGLRILARVKAQVGYVLDRLPAPQPVVSLLQRLGGVSDEEMF
jgi:phosphoribosylaminoimidazole (AIR) synthetase